MIRHLITSSTDAEAYKPILSKPSHRLLAVLSLLVITLLFHDVSMLSGIALGYLVILLWCGISFRHVVKRLLLIIPFGLGAIIFTPFNTAGQELFTLLRWTATSEGVQHGLVLLLKLVGANLLLTYLLATTPMFDLIKSLRSIGIPAVMIELMGLMMRYFFLLLEESKSMLKAQKSRGMQMEGWFWSLRTYRRFGQLLGVLFIRALSRSERIYLSISARGGMNGGFVKEKKGDSLEYELPVEKKVTGTMTDKTAETITEIPGTLAGVRAGRITETTEEVTAGTMTAIELRNTSYRYGDIHALKDVSLIVAKGAKVALMGPNGAGKSTLISLLNGLEQPVGGEVYLFGERLDFKAREQAHRRLGVVYQDPDDQIFSTTVEEDVAFGPRNLGLSEAEVEERVVTALGSVGMKDYRKRSPFELSYGQKRRVAIAGVLAMQPEIIVLDEPMAFLDPKGRDELQFLLDAMHLMGMTLIVATHDVDFAAEWADDIVILKEGCLLASGGTELLFDEAIIDKADLHLPRLARPFRMLEGTEDLKPKNVKQAAQMIWRLMVRRSEEKQVDQKQADPLRGLKK